MQSRMSIVNSIDKYPLNEIFVSLQGEANFAGTPSIFIRMQGCNVGCGWCDTKHTWQLVNKNQQSVTDIIAKQGDKNNWAYVTITELIKYIQGTFPQISHVVITGGEPAQYNLYPLCTALEQIGKTIQIETSGTEKLLVTDKTWVTLSPKINMPGKKEIIITSVKRANEIKMPIGKTADIITLQLFIEKYSIDDNTPIWLQPLSQNLSATNLCIKEALKQNWKLSIQTHKYLGIR